MDIERRRAEATTTGKRKPRLMEEDELPDWIKLDESEVRDTDLSSCIPHLLFGSPLDFLFISYLNYK